jgi:hypothetical protein
MGGREEKRKEVKEVWGWRSIYPGTSHGCGGGQTQGGVGWKRSRSTKRNSRAGFVHGSGRLPPALADVHWIKPCCRRRLAAWLAIRELGRRLLIAGVSAGVCLDASLDRELVCTAACVACPGDPGIEPTMLAASGRNEALLNFAAPLEACSSLVCDSPGPSTPWKGIGQHGCQRNE